MGGGVEGEHGLLHVIVVSLCVKLEVCTLQHLYLPRTCGLRNRANFASAVHTERCLGGPRRADVSFGVTCRSNSSQTTQSSKKAQEEHQ